MLILWRGWGIKLGGGLVKKGGRVGDWWLGVHREDAPNTSARISLCLFENWAILPIIII